MYNRLVTPIIPDEVKKVEEIMVKIGRGLVDLREEGLFGEITYKQGKEIVSGLDSETEAKIRRKVKKVFPNYKIWGEELGKDHGNLDREKFIIIDAIDGTKNYLSGNPLFATQIACMDMGEIKWGIIVLPVLKEVFIGIKGLGSYLNGNKISPSKQDNFSLANQCFGLGHEAKTFIKLLSLIKDQLAEPRSYGCAGVHFAFTACGRIDVYLAREAGFYDMAPGLIICKEAGLEMCNLEGEEYTADGGLNTGVVIANKELIEQYKKIRNKIL